MSHPTFPETFIAQRDEDVSGVSGEGVIAEGVRFSDGWVVTHWLDQPPMHEPKTDVWHNPGTRPFERIHGHGGATRILWHHEVTAAQQKLRADLITAFDVPPELYGSEAEADYFREQISRRLQGASGEVKQDYKPMDHFGSVPYPLEVSGRLDAYVDAVMPLLEGLISQRSRAEATASRAYRLADRWAQAHGASAFLVRAASVELRDVLDDDASETDVHPAAAECSAQSTRFTNGRRQCIRAALHRGDHIDEQGFHWSDTAAIYPVLGGRLRCGRAGASSCTSPDHACKVCGDCMYEHPGEAGCASSRGTDIEELVDTVQSVLGIDARATPRDVNTWLITACRQLEKSEDARERLRGQRNAVAQALREVLAVFRPVTVGGRGQVFTYEALHAVLPSNFNCWRQTLDKLPANCAKPGGCPDCPHEPEA